MTGDEKPPRATRAYGTPGSESDHYPPTVSDPTPPRMTSAESAVMPIAHPLDAILTRYRIGDVIGRGGMGEVVSARDEQVGRWVAIKRLKMADPSPEVLSRFLREARVQARLEHPAVVPVHDLHHEEGVPPYFVMKQLTGVTLADVIPRLAQRDPRALDEFPRQRLLRAFAEVCLAIEFAHTRGIIHRDLKPANIQLGEFGEVYVLDWGIARVAEERGRERGSFADIDTAVGGGSVVDRGTETVAGAILGTPGYISPEQIRGEPTLDGRADVYALGCILFEILAHQPLHPRGQPAIASALAGVDARASVRAPEREVPPELDAICIRATALEASHRFATARQLGDAVQRYLDGNRDMALRRELCRAELDIAREAIASGTTPAARGTAIRAAARALALDPTNREPADLVGRLMLEPPKTVPPEVEAELQQLDLEALRKSARFGLFAALALLGFFPVLYLIGLRHTPSLLGGIAICLFIVAIEIIVAPTHPRKSTYLSNAGYIALFALLSWMLNPVIIGPGPAVIVVMMMASHRGMYRPWKLSLLLGIGIVSPWLLGAFGVMSTTTTIDGGSITLHTMAHGLDPTITLVAIGVYIQATILIGGWLSRLAEDQRRAVRRTSQVQSWQLRQLVPRPATAPPV